MALQDHFQPPLSLRRHWHAFHNAWATYLSADLNEQLPEGYFAEPNVQFGIEIDVAAVEEPGPVAGIARRPGGQREAWTASLPTQTVPIAIITDVVKVLVFSREAGPVLANAIELVSPANKDRPPHRDAFVSKCAAYLQQGIGLIVVDVVTSLRANLHEEPLARLQTLSKVPLDSELYAVAYRPVTRAGQHTLDTWQEPLALGHSLPTMPLWLKAG